MRPLNRPMFKYGGPIKEGIMDGMKEKQAINTVGNNANRDEMGREKHAFFLPFLGAAGLQGLRMGAMRMAPRIASYFRTQVGTKAVPKQGPTLIDKGKFVPAKNVRIPSSGTYSGVKFQPGNAPIGPGTAQVPVMGNTKLGSYFASDPIFRTGAAIVKGVTNPASKGAIQKGARFVFSPSGILTGAYFAGGKFFNSDGTEIKNPEEKGLTPGDRIGTSGAPGGGDPNMFATPKEKVVNQEELEKMNKDKIQATKDRYYKIFGLDNMKKDAVYDSLIDASKIISEEGADLKGAVKSGTLQNRIIQAISGQLDKSAALKRQIDAAVLKGEIEKDIKASDPKAAKQAELIDKQIALADQKLSGGSLIENIEAGKKAAGGANSTANVYNSVIRSFNTEPTVLADTTEASKLRKLDNYTTDAALVETIVKEQNKGSGIYILDKTVVYIDEKGNSSTLALG